MICDAAVILAFAEDVSVRVICVAAVTLSCQSVLQECQESESSKSVLQECQVRVSCKSVKQECHVRVAHTCQERVSYKSVKKECLTRVSSTIVAE